MTKPWTSLTDSEKREAFNEVYRRALEEARKDLSELTCEATLFEKQKAVIRRRKMALMTLMKSIDDLSIIADTASHRSTTPE